MTIASAAVLQTKLQQKKKSQMQLQKEMISLEDLDIVTSAVLWKGPI